MVDSILSVFKNVSKNNMIINTALADGIAANDVACVQKLIDEKTVQVETHLKAPPRTKTTRLVSTSPCLPLCGKTTSTSWGRSFHRLNIDKPSVRVLLILWVSSPKPEQEDVDHHQSRLQKQSRSRTWTASWNPRLRKLCSTPRLRSAHSPAPNYCLRFTSSTLKTLSSVLFCFPERGPYRCVGLVRDDDPAALRHHRSEQCCQDGELFPQIGAKELYEYCIFLLRSSKCNFSIYQPFYVLSDWWIMWRWSCCWTTEPRSTPVSNEKEAQFFTKASRRATSRWWRPSLKIRLDAFCKSIKTQVFSVVHSQIFLFESTIAQKIANNNFFLEICCNAN